MTILKEIAENVVLDTASAYRWEDLYETAFLTRFFNCLRHEMDDFCNYTFYILSSHTPSTIPHSADNGLKNKVLFFISDELGSIPFALRQSYLAIFKCYLPHEIPGSNIFPFNIGYIKDVPEFDPLPIEVRPINVFFSGSLNSNRIAFYSALHPIFRHLPTPIAAVTVTKYRFPLRANFATTFPNSQIQFTSGFKHGISPKFYGKLLCKSKIALCPKGAKSSETFRHMEALRAGAVVLSEELPDTHFYRGSPIVTIANWREGLRTTQKLLVHPNSLVGLHKQSLAWWRDVCSEAATAKFVAKQINLVVKAL